MIQILKRVVCTKKTVEGVESITFVVGKTNESVEGRLDSGLRQLRWKSHIDAKVV